MGAEQDEANIVGQTGVVLAKIRTTDRLLGAAARVGVEPLRAAVPGRGPGRFALDGTPQWFAVQAEPDASPWDQAHAHVAERLGIDRSDVLFVEPDLVHAIFHESSGPDGGDLLAVGADCGPVDQDGSSGKPVGPGFAWHLERDFSQLARARAAVGFADPRTRVAHIDTGYSAGHETTPGHIDDEHQRNFVRSDRNLTSAIDPDNDLRVMDNSGHGTGTLSVLAGGLVASQGQGELGGAPEAEIVPIRIADRVVLLRTSALARAIMYAGDIGCAVGSLSMGGLPSKAWAEAVDDAYEVGLCLVAAGGNRIGELPPRSLVYPARYPRVIAVTGVMADGSPYENLGGRTLEGSFGPTSAMESAIAAYTPNIPWAVFGCPDTTRLNGEGTSAATPQVAAAAALWIEKYKDVLPADWRRVEAVRHALFSTAKARGRANRKRFGNGVLQAHRALSVQPNLRLDRSPRSTNRLAVFRMLSGLFVEGESPREEMFDLELLQLWMTNGELAALIPDPETASPLTADEYGKVLDVVLADPRPSSALRHHLTDRYRHITRRPPPPSDGGPATRAKVVQAEPPMPSRRRLRVFAKDPTLASSFSTSSIGEVSLDVPWEPVIPTVAGFHGEYVEVVDDLVEPVASATTAPGLDHPHLLAQEGWAPSPGNLHFHQQMVYAVSMKTIEHFERALGRPVQWRPRQDPARPRYDGGYRARLLLRPHALAVANAYYSPDEGSVLFGSFALETSGSTRRAFPIHTCLSHDIVAHETTHAIIDGLYRRFSEPTNLDVLAFHEAFADIVALLQSFDMTQFLEYEIRTSRGDLEADTLLGKLAVEFGNAARGREALRSVIGSSDGGTWVRSAPDSSALTGLTTPHARGAILVSAVFDALIAIYESRTSDLFRIATGGTGRLPDGAIHPDLARRLSEEAAKAARHLLGMCIRALDYLPPVDVTFFDFLRALVTADYELVPDDRFNYRVAIVEAFVKRGIGPSDNDAAAEGLRSLTAESLLWAGFVEEDAAGLEAEYGKIVEALRMYAEACGYITDREELFKTTRTHRGRLNTIFGDAFTASDAFRTSLGLEGGSFEVHALRRAMRVRPNGRVEPEAIVSLLQSRVVGADKKNGVARHRRLGGVTMIVNLTTPDLPRYRVVKAMDDPVRRAAMNAFAVDNAADPLRTLYLAADAEQFGALHHLAGES